MSRLPVEPEQSRDDIAPGSPRRTSPRKIPTGTLDTGAILLALFATGGGVSPVSLAIMAAAAVYVIGRRGR